jgi:arylsulfatase I/J
MEFLVATLLGCALAANPSPVHPHIFLIIADDYGWHNIGYHNPEISSPNLDGLAADGIKLNRHYVFKYCSPTRSSLLTGRLPLHVNQNNECNDELSLSGPDLRMTFLPQKLKKAGYRTAMTGKWHLGARTTANLPINRGFDTHLGFLKGGQDHLNQKDGSESMGLITDIWANHTPAYGKNGTYSTLIYGPEAVRIVEDHPVGKGAPPLFMYLSFQNTHSPYQVPSQYLDPAVKNKPRQIINAMVNVMDEAVGNLTSALKRKDMWKDTLIVFSADNGGITRGGGCGNNFPLRGQKTSSWEGGVRAVAFVSGGTSLIAPELRGTTNNAYIHACDW